MKEKIILFSIIAFTMLLPSAVVFAYQNPTANAGPDLYVSSGQSITLQGSGYDPQSSALTYYWNCSGGTLSSSTIAQPTFTAPSTTSQNYTCSLTVTNSYSLSGSDSMTVFVNSNNNTNFNVQTNSATNIQNNSATLNGYLYNSNSYNTSALVWFQWGTDTNYGNTTFQQTLSYPGSFFQSISNLSPNITYHFRAAAQSNGSTVYGQDMTFNSNSSTYYGNGILTTNKQVINLSTGNLNWQTSVNAKPGDILSFAITMQAGNQDIHNVVVHDNLPANLIYKGNLTVNATTNYSGNPSAGINIGTIPANGVEIVSYQVQVAQSTNFIYGSTTLSNSATITSTESGTQTARSTVIVNTTTAAAPMTYYGPTYISTGLTNNPVTDSFFLPILLIILGSWFYFSGNVYKFSDWFAKYI